MKWYLIPLLVLATEAQGTEAFRLDSATVNYRKYQEGSRSPLFYDSSPNFGLALDLSASVFEVIGVEANVHSATNQAQFYLVGLEYSVFLRVTPALDIGWYHHSQHLLDTAYPYSRFPVEDAIQVRFRLYENTKPRRSVLE